MEIYAKDNKVLSYNNKCIKPKASGETWVIDERPNFDKTEEEILLQIDFVSNNMAFDLINVGYGQDVLFYGGPTTGVFTVYDSGKWTDQAYRTITFIESPTGDLLAWLQANGVKQ